MVKSSHELPPSKFFDWRGVRYLGDGHLASNRSVEPNGLALLHIPPITSRKPIESWSIPPFTVDIFSYAAYPPGNVLAVAEQRER